MEDLYRQSLEEGINKLIGYVRADILNREEIDMLYGFIEESIVEELDKGNYIDVKLSEDILEDKNISFVDVLVNRLIRLGEMTAEHSMDIDYVVNLLHKIAMQIGELHIKGKYIVVEDYLQWEELILMSYYDLFEKDKEDD